MYEEQEYHRAVQNMLSLGLGAVGGGPPLMKLSIAKELELSIKALEEQLEIKRKLQKLLTDNPAIEEFMNLSRGIL